VIRALNADPLGGAGRPCDHRSAVRGARRAPTGTLLLAEADSDIVGFVHLVLREAPALPVFVPRRVVATRARRVHVSIQRTHVHMLVEAENQRALARGMQGFQISAARNINTALGVDKYRRRRGPVFADRYHLTVITTPTQTRNAIGYVLSNWRKHGEDRQGLPSTWLVDPFSSGILFPDWKELEGKDVMWPWRETYDPLMVRRPKSWLLREGWKKAGAISARDVPSKRP
jgi:hypothetical protein